MLDTKRLISRFLRYVACPSESLHEGDFCRLLEKEIKDMGYDVLREETGDKFGSDGFNLYTRIQGGSEKESILLCAHMDTVSPGTGIEPVIHDGVITAKNTILAADDKSGVAVIMELLEAFRDQKPARTVEVLFTLSEEIGMLGSRYSDYSRMVSKQAVVLDSCGPLCNIINKAPLVAYLHIEVFGRAAHAGISFNDGIHALKAAADMVSAIPVGYVDEISEINVSNFLAPCKENVVCPKATFDMEIRSFSRQRYEEHLDFIKNVITKTSGAYGTTYTLRVTENGDCVYTPENSPVIALLREAYKKKGIEIKLCPTYGVSDICNISAAGMQAVNISVGYDKPHSVQESIAVKAFETVAEILYDLVR
ncbi:MAG: M20/M25/M40 family metallo-hydrolase [Christensenellales bacterium]